MADNGKDNQSIAYSVIAIIIAMFFWALSFPLLIWALAEVKPLTLAMLRSVILIPPMLVYMHLTCGGLKKSVAVLKDNKLMFLLLAVTTVTIPNITQNLGMTLNQSSSITGILQSSGPVYTVILAAIFLKERMGYRQYFGLFFGLIGSILLATNGFQYLHGGTFIGNMLVIFSAISYSFSSIIGKKALSHHNTSLIISWSLIIGAIILVPVGLTEQMEMPSTNGWLLIVGLAIMPSFIAYICWYSVMKYMPVSKLIITIYSVPVLTIILSYFLLGETLTLNSVIFSAMILVGVIIATIGSFSASNKKT